MASNGGARPCPGLDHLRDNPRYDLTSGKPSRPLLRELIAAVGAADVVAAVLPGGVVEPLKAPAEANNADGSLTASAVSIRLRDPLQVVPLAMALEQAAAGRPFTRAQLDDLAGVLERKPERIRR